LSVVLQAAAPRHDALMPDESVCFKREHRLHMLYKNRKIVRVSIWRHPPFYLCIRLIPAIRADLIADAMDAGSAYDSLGLQH
tara:strand:+ start:6810 stop:7055 length:246 start_codon:yes stop_codon:yes gene_type:complete